MELNNYEPETSFWNKSEETDDTGMKVVSFTGVNLRPADSSGVGCSVKINYSSIFLFRKWICKYLV